MGDLGVGFKFLGALCPGAGMRAFAVAAGGVAVVLLAGRKLGKVFGARLAELCRRGQSAHVLAVAYLMAPLAELSFWAFWVASVFGLVVQNVAGDEGSFESDEGCFRAAHHASLDDGSPSGDEMG